jgi:hypothetical protein
MAVTITRTPWIDDDGTGTTGTVINNAVKTSLYNEIDAALAKLIPATGPGSGLIAFPATQVPSADPNTLDDYEEGTWTPVVGGSGGTSGQSYATQIGLYVKVGQIVLASFNIGLTAKGTITGNMGILGFPFLPSANAFFVAAIGFHQLATPMVSVLANIASNSAIALLTGISAPAGSNVAALLLPSDIGNGTIFQGACMYRAAQ